MRRAIAGTLLALAACGPADMDGAGDDGGLARGPDTAAVATSERKAAAEAELMRLEREFAAASAREGASAWSSRWAPNGRSYGGGEERIGPGAIGESIASMLERYGERFTWAPDTAVVSESGDLGYALGRYAILGDGDEAGDTIARGHYVTIWQRQADGDWKIAVDIGT